MQCSFDGVKFLQNHEESLYGKKFDLWHGFTYTEMIDNVQRQYYFGSDTPIIYDNLVNNVKIVRKLIVSSARASSPITAQMTAISKYVHALNHSLKCAELA